jgi:tetratricopeptide (TPR) repeat protein
VPGRTTKGILLALAGLVFPGGSLPQTQALPTAATTATVTRDSLVVYADMSRSSETVRSLSKGDSVYVDLRVDQGGLKWCGIRLTAGTVRLGFADCQGLLRTSAPPTPAAAGPRPGSAEMPFAWPATPTQDGYAAVRAQVINDDVVDSGYIAAADDQARSGGSAAVTRAALAHYAAAEFELSRNEPDRAIEHLQAMEPYAGRQRELLLACLVGRGYALLMKSEFSLALGPLGRARQLAPNSAQAAALSGWAHYRLNQTDQAIADFEAASRGRPGKGIEQLLEKLKRDRDAESDFREGASSHFVVRYHGGASRQLASEVTRTLEDQFQSLRDQLHFTPPEPIAVILYTQEAFRDVTRSPEWEGALNDGKIRVPVQGMDSVSAEMAAILRHELTHSFLSQKTSGRCPTWLHEGIAQWMEGRRSRGDAAMLVAAFDEGWARQLRRHDDVWRRLSLLEARYAYAWSLAMVEMIESTGGPDAVNKLLEAERSEPSRESALREGLRMNPSSLDDATVEYLKRTYLQ